MSPTAIQFTCFSVASLFTVSSATFQVHFTKISFIIALFVLQCTPLQFSLHVSALQFCSQFPPLQSWFSSHTFPLPLHHCVLHCSPPQSSLHVSVCTQTPEKNNAVDKYIYTFMIIIKCLMVHWAYPLPSPPTRQRKKKGKKTDSWNCWINLAQNFHNIYYFRIMRINV